MDAGDDPGPAPEPGPDPLDTCPRPGTPVVAACGLPHGTHSHHGVAAGTKGEIVHCPAHFSLGYSIRFDVHGVPVTLHGLNRHEFRIVDGAGHEVEPGFPPAARYPQPATRATPPS